MTHLFYAYMHPGQASAPAGQKWMAILNPMTMTTTRQTSSRKRSSMDLQLPERRMTSFTRRCAARRRLEVTSTSESSSPSSRLCSSVSSLIWSAMCCGAAPGWEVVWGLLHLLVTARCCRPGSSRAAAAAAAAAAAKVPWCPLRCAPATPGPRPAPTSPAAAAAPARGCSAPPWRPSRGPPRRRRQPPPAAPPARPAAGPASWPAASAPAARAAR